jgi:hypothetical protein
MNSNLSTFANLRDLITSIRSLWWIALILWLTNISFFFRHSMGLSAPLYHDLVSVDIGVVSAFVYRNLSNHGSRGEFIIGPAIFLILTVAAYGAVQVYYGFIDLPFLLSTCIVGVPVFYHFSGQVNPKRSQVLGPAIFFAFTLVAYCSAQLFYGFLDFYFILSILGVFVILAMGGFKIFKRQIPQ